MIRRTEAAAYLPTFRDHKDIVAAIGAGTNGQLVRAILKNFPSAVAQTKKLAQRFNTGSLYSTGEAVWNFLKYQIKYREDSGLLQHMRLPNALVTTGTGDCKSYSLFAAGIMANLGYKVSFKFTGYNGSTIPGHVYITASNGSETVIIDAVWKQYNSEKKPYSYSKLYPMEIATISGIGCADCGGDIGKINLKKSLQKAKTAVKKAATTAAKVVKPAAQLIKKAAGLAPRTAFLQLVKLNVHDFANRLDRNRNKALDKWAKLGGMKGELNASINAGKNRKAILGLDESNGIGEPATVSVATVLVAAAPIIAALASLLGPGKTTESPTTDATVTVEETTASNNAAAEIINAAAKVIENTANRATPTPSGPAPAPGSGGSNNFSFPPLNTEGGPSTTASRTAEAASTGGDAGGDNKMFIYLGLGVLAFMLLKK